MEAKAVHDEVVAAPPRRQADDVRHLEPYLDAKVGLSIAFNASLPTSILYDSTGHEVWRMVGGMDWATPSAQVWRTHAPANHCSGVILRAGLPIKTLGSAAPTTAQGIPQLPTEAGAQRDCDFSAQRARLLLLGRQHQRLEGRTRVLSGLCRRIVARPAAARHDQPGRRALLITG